MATKKFQSQFAETPMAFLRKVSLVLLHGGSHAVCLQEAGAGVWNVGWKGVAHPFVRTCMGRSSGPYTHGTQFIEAPKISMNRKKNATDTQLAVSSSAVP